VISQRTRVEIIFEYTGDNMWKSFLSDDQLVFFISVDGRQEALGKEAHSIFF